MPDLLEDTTATDIIADVQATLKAARLGGQDVFADVQVYEDLPAFQAVANGAQGVVAGIIPGLPQRALGLDNSEDHLTRLPFVIAIKLLSTRAPGTGNVEAMKEMNRFAELVRLALRQDPRRGNRATPIMWASKLLDATDALGEAKLVPIKSPTAYFVATVQFACGWTVGL